MANISKTYASDALATNVTIDLRKRTIDPDTNPVVQYYGLVTVYFEGGRYAVQKEVTLDELTAGERADLIAGAAALHALAVGKVTAGDF